MANSAQARVGGPRLRRTALESDQDYSHWGLTTPDPDALITWTFGAVAADEATRPAATTSERKFFQSTFGGLIKRSYHPTPAIQIGAHGSVAMAYGHGRSYPESGLIWQDYTVEWQVFAYGYLGSHPEAGYASQARAEDPLRLTTGTLAELGVSPGDRVDLLLPTELSGLSLQDDGAVELHVGFQTTAGRRSLLDLSIPGDGTARATGAEGPGLRILPISSFLEDPVGTGRKPLDLDGIRDLGAALVKAPGGSGLQLAFLLEDFEIPADTMEGGVHAQFEIATQVSAAGESQREDREQKVRG